MQLTWHQQDALRRAYRLRNHAAHIHGPDYVATGKCLCGIKDPPVYVEPEHAENPANGTCKKCLAALRAKRSATV